MSLVDVNSTVFAASGDKNPIFEVKLCLLVWCSGHFEGMCYLDVCPACWTAPNSRCRLKMSRFGMWYSKNVG